MKELYMNKKQHQFLNENRILKNSIELLSVWRSMKYAILTLHEKYNTLKINGQTFKYKIKVQAL